MLVPAFGERLQDLVVAFQRPEFELRRLFLRRQLCLLHLLARHQVEAASPHTMHRCFCALAGGFFGRGIA